MSKHIENVKEFHRRAGQGIADKPTIPSDEVRLLRAKLIFEEAMETIHAMGVNVLMDDNYEYEAIPILRKNTEYRNLYFEISKENECNLAEVADGCADLIVVTTGTQLEFGFPIEEVQEEVDQSNLAKFTGDYKIREDGKIIKPSDWKAPDIKGILEKHGLKDNNE